MSIDERVRASLDRRAADVAPNEALWRRIDERTRAPRREGARRIAVGAVALLLAAASFAFVLRAFRSDPAADLPAQDVSTWQIREFEVGSDPGELTAADGSIWISREGIVTRVEVESGTVQDIPVELERGGSRGAVAPDSELSYGDGRVWFAAEPFFASIDARTGELDRGFVWESGVTSVVYDGGRLFYGGSAEGNGMVVALDVTTHESDTWLMGNAYPTVVVTEHWVWAVEATSLTRARRDNELSPGESIVGIDAVDSVTVLGEAVWVTGDGALWKVDASAPDPSASPRSESHGRAEAIVLERSVEAQATVAGGGGHLWLLEEGSAGTILTELDPSTGSPLGDGVPVPHTGPSELAVDGDGVPWATFRDDGVLVGLTRSAGSAAPSGSPESVVEYLSPDERWAPETFQDGGKIVMPVTFPNGTAAEVVFDQAARLDQMSVHPTTNVEGPGNCGTELSATRYDPRGSWVSGPAPLRTHMRPDGTAVEIWDGTRDHEPYDGLIFRAGAWSLILLCQNGGDMSDAAFATWADALHVQESDDGLIFVDASEPLEANPYDDVRGGPTIQFDDRDVIVELRATDGCDHLTGDQETDDGVIQWCINRAAGIYLYATSFGPSGREVLDALVESVQVHSIGEP